MSIFSSLSSIRITGVLSLAVLVLASATIAHPESEFDRAHTILSDLSRLQKHQQDKETTEALTRLIATGPTAVEQLLNNGLLALLNSPGNHSAADLRQKLTATLQVAPPEQYSPEVFVFAVGSQGLDLYVVSYNIGYCAACSRNWIGVFGRSDGAYRVLASEENPFPNHSLTTIWLPQTTDGKPRFLTYGSHWGDPHSRLSATAFAFAGAQLRAVWSRKDLPQGTIKVSPNEIRLSFLNSLRPPWTEEEETYAILPERIELRESSERPIP